jgi:hypothetical protein
MITIPSSVSLPVNGSTNPLIFVDAIWSPDNQEYLTPPSAGAADFTTGKAYWVRLRQPTTLQIPPTTVTTPTFNINLSMGWNMIGVPYANPGSLSAASVTIGTLQESLAVAVNSNQLSGLFSYNNTTGAYNAPISSGTPAAYTGYWIYAKQACTLTVSGS